MAARASTTKSLAVSDIRSRDCKEGQQPHVMQHYLATNSEDPLQVYQNYVMACPTTKDGTPATCDNVNSAVDSQTKKQMQDTAAKMMGVDAGKVNVSILGCNDIGMNDVKAMSESLHRNRMATNCGPAYNLNNITNYNRFTCRYLGTGKDDKGRDVWNPFKTWSGTLPSCESSISISDQTEMDVKRLAYFGAAGDEAGLDVNKFSCDIFSVPLT